MAQTNTGFVHTYCVKCRATKDRYKLHYCRIYYYNRFISARFIYLYYYIDSDKKC